MRVVLLVNDFQPPWDEAGKNNALQVALRLAGRHDVFVMGLGETTGRDRVERLPVFRATSPGYRGAWKRLLYPLGYLNLLLHGSRRLREIRPDVLLCFWETASTGIPAHLLRLAGAPSARLVQVVWTDSYRWQPASPGTWLREHLPNLLFNGTWMASLAGRLADEVVATSRYLATRMTAAGVRRVAVGGHGVDTERHRPGPPMPGPRPPGGVVGYLGHATHAKGLAILLEALAAPLAAGRFELWLALSDSPEAAELRESRPRGVRFFGYVPPMVFFNSCDVVVFPRVSSYGTASYPNALLEAMACGRPVVTTRQPGISEVVHEGLTGFLVPPGDPVMLGRRVETLLSDDAVRRRVGQAAREFVERRLSWEKAMVPLEESIQSGTNGLVGASPQTGPGGEPPPGPGMGRGYGEARLQGDAVLSENRQKNGFPKGLRPFGRVRGEAPIGNSVPIPSPRLVVARDHVSLLEVLRDHGRRGLSLLHVDQHCDMRGWLVDGPGRRGRWLVRSRRLDSGNVLAHAADEGWVNSVYWLHGDDGGRRYDLGTYVELEEAARWPWKWTQARAVSEDEERWRPLQVQAAPASKARCPEQLDAFSLDWDYFAPFPCPAQFAAGRIARFFDWMGEHRQAPGLIFVCSSPGYSSAHRELFDAFVERLLVWQGGVAELRTPPWSGVYGGSAAGRCATLARNTARAVMVAAKRTFLRVAGAGP